MVVTRGNNANNPNPNINVQLDGAALDTFIPKIPKANNAAIKEKFKYQVLTPLEGEPTYEQMKEIKRQLARNALTSKVSFGGGKHGCLPLVIGGTLFTQETQQTWTLPASQGAYPTFNANLPVGEKKKAISQFIEAETDLKIVKATEEILKNQFIDVIEEKYIKELRQGFAEYDNRSLLDLLEHVDDKYAKLDEHVLQEIMEKFNESPDLSLPIDVYFEKQEECQRQAKDTEHPIQDKTMVLKLQEHMGESVTLTKKKIKFAKKPKQDQTWANGKDFYRDAIEDLKEAAKCAGTDTKFFANAAPREAAEDKVRQEMVDRMGESFDTLAMAAEASKETYEEQARTIAALTKTNGELSATNKKLTEKIVVLTEQLLARDKKSNQQPSPRAATKEKNSAGVLCDVETKTNQYGRKYTFFKEKQLCEHCKEMKVHLPKFCPERPERKALKEAEEALKKAKANAN